MYRKEHRLKEYDYSTANYYFITINTYNKQNVFGEIVDNKMILNDNGKVLSDTINTIFDNGKVEMICSQIMPNHIHFIIEIMKDGQIKLPAAVSYFKSTISKKIVDIKPLWTRGYYDRVIRNKREFDNVYKYIINNPYREKYHW